MALDLCFAPKGHHVKAWGNAPGKRRGKVKAPTGRNEFATLYRPVGAFGSYFGVYPGRCPGLSHFVPLARNRNLCGRHTLCDFGPESHCVLSVLMSSMNG